MADDIKVSPSATPSDPSVATDEVAGRHYQLVKLAFGADGSATLVGASGLPVALDAASLAALETINVGNFPATQPVSADALPLPAGASTEATLAALKAVADTIATAAAAIQIAAEALNAKATTINTGAIAGTVALDAGSLAALETIQVGNFPTGFFVTGAVEITNDSGAAIPVSATALPLPTGAATQATLASVDGKLPALDTGRVPVILPAGGGGLTDSELRASAVPVIQSGATTGTPANVAASAASVVLLAANAARKGAVIYNDSTATLYVLLAASAASPSAFTEQLAPGESLVLERGDYAGEIRGIWTAAAGYARVTEIS